MMGMPAWVLKHKKKGTQVTKIGKNYYLYKVTSVWDPKKKRAKKITQGYLGKITPEGVIKPKHKRVLEEMKHVSVKEFGASQFLYDTNKDIIKLLQHVFPESWKEIFLFSAFRFLHLSPIKNVQTYYQGSFFSEMIPDAHLSPKPVSTLLRDVGMFRGRVKNVLKPLITGTEFALVDLTHVLSRSGGVVSSVPGYNSKRDFTSQIHLAFLFSLDEHMPAFFRLLPGSLRDVSSLVLTVKEAGVKNAVLIGDKGFYSLPNILDLEKEENSDVHYIFPLKRNSSLIDYTPIQKGDSQSFDGYLRFQKRVVWHYSYKIDQGDLQGKRIVVFLDERLKTEEEKDYISRMEDSETSKNTLDSFYELQYRQGTIAVITDLDTPAEKVYTILKSRPEIETMFDVFKNVLEADRTYMRDDHQMEGWMFINFLALVFYYRLYHLLSDHDLLKKYSPKDVLLHLSRVKKLQVNDKWITSEVPKKTRLINEKLNIHIT